MKENIITSVTNERIKEIRKLYDKKYRRLNQKYIIEGIKIIEEAYIQNQIFDTIVICSELYDNISIDKQIVKKCLEENEDKIIYVDKKVFYDICDTQTPQGIIGVLNIQINENVLLDNENILFLDNIQDAGNLGTIIRSARAFGFNEIIVNKGSIDVYNQKVIRASMGNIFLLHILQLEDEGLEMLGLLKGKGYTVYATTLDNAQSIYDVEYASKKVIVIGNEANGVNDDILKFADKNIYIPMLNNTESLNAGVAASIIMCDVQRKI